MLSCAIWIKANLDLALLNEGLHAQQHEADGKALQMRHHRRHQVRIKAGKVSNQYMKSCRAEAGTQSTGQGTLPQGW